MILLSISPEIVTKKLFRVSVIIFGLDSVLLLMFMDLICLRGFVLRLIIDLTPFQFFQSCFWILQNSAYSNLTY